MIKYGFELEGFVVNRSNKKICVPPKGIPTDGFPGLVELRTTGGKNIFGAAAELFQQYLKAKSVLDDNHDFDFESFTHKFGGDDLRELRRRDQNKVAQDYVNLYGKAMRNTNGYTLASFQINISLEISSSYTTKEGSFIPARYGLLDIPNIVRNLDKTFEKELKFSIRTPGWYSIKDNYSRLEYRSLPNFVGRDILNGNSKLLTTIQKAVEGWC